ncbi:sugar ABC transporter substrate-binding protein [Aeromicrobium endophyticum]|uniref:Sugar ABC transporter substrate-binding protein n=1 Tax=Aeromicrobium endophyticum TaxID=2292704 RepID=A0A371NZ09_9ACTN|nr:substrate-binding domain-containing protein [Aeromicrobium endophyticum]REK68841.1 sugar ABC transporter substrate-binding protein [Aeromicrobium endophyticum]
MSHFPGKPRLVSRAAVAGALVVLSLTGCAATSDGGGAAAKGDADSKVNVAVLNCTAAPYCVAGNDALTGETATLGVKAKMYDAVFDPAKTVSSCKDAIASRKYNVMVINSAIPSASVACATAAKAAGVPVIGMFGPIGTDTAHAEPTTPGVLSQVLVPLDTQVDTLIDDIVVPACANKNPCEIGWLRTTKSLPQGDAIIDKKLSAALKVHTNLKLVGEVSSETEVGAAVTATKTFLQKDPGLDLILSYATQGTSGAITALKAEGKAPGEDVLIATAGGSQDVMAAMRRGEVYGTIVNLPATEMKIAVGLAADVVRGKKIPTSVDPLESAGLPRAITQTNLKDFPDFEGEYTQ